LTYPSALKMEAVCLFEMFVDFYETTQLYITETSTIHILEDSAPKDLFCMFTARHTPE
jgi:hypothetical protein